MNSPGAHHKRKTYKKMNKVALTPQERNRIKYAIRETDEVNLTQLAIRFSRGPQTIREIYQEVQDEKKQQGTEQVSEGNEAHTIRPYAGGSIHGSKGR